MKRRTSIWLLFALLLAGGLALMAAVRARAEYELTVATSLRCSFCGRVGPSTGHMLVLADERLDIPWGPSAKRWGACAKCWQRVKKETMALMERIAREEGGTR